VPPETDVIAIDIPLFDPPAYEITSPPVGKLVKPACVSDAAEGVADPCEYDSEKLVAAPAVVCVYEPLPKVAPTPVRVPFDDAGTSKCPIVPAVIPVLDIE
jgi:hypothetical protein|tara:strand:+ start:161 stop:463 length:303 start_codon:yes stop_codon:yes gene_type:complete